MAWDMRFFCVYTLSKYGLGVGNAKTNLKLFKK